jgi:hypothetical protein
MSTFIIIYFKLPSFDHVTFIFTEYRSTLHVVGLEDDLQVLTTAPKVKYTPLRGHFY